MTQRQTLHCIEPGAISRDDLLAYARGEAGAGVREHLSRCAFCRVEAAAYAQLEAGLHERLYREACPSSTTLGEYVLGMLAPAEARAVAEHLLECPNCAQERRVMSSFMAEPDEPLREPGVLPALRRLFALPVVNRSPAPALRGAQSPPASYTVEGFALSLSVQAPFRGTGRVVVGLLLAEGTATEGAAVRLLDGEQLLRRTAIDDLGNFLIDDVPPGTYRLEFTLPDAIIVVDPADVP